MVLLVTAKTPSLLVYPGNGSWVYPQTSLVPTLSSAFRNVRFRTNVQVFEVLISSYVKYE